MLDEGGLGRRSSRDFEVDAVGGCGRRMDDHRMVFAKVGKFPDAAEHRWTVEWCLSGSSVYARG
jgi:hypothetical protein